jgi:hypothetical protein
VSEGENNAPRGCGLLIAIVLWAGSAIGFINGLDSLYNSFQSSQTTRWSTTTALILKSEVERREPTEEHRRDPARYGQLSRPSYRPRVLYAFDVDGQRYESQRMALEGTVYGSADEAEASLARFPVGSEVTVHYNPAKPDESVLTHAFSWGGVIFGLLFLGGSSIIPLLWWWGYRAKRRQENSKLRPDT